MKDKLYSTIIYSILQFYSSSKSGENYMNGSKLIIKVSFLLNFIKDQVLIL